MRVQATINLGSSDYPDPHYQLKAGQVALLPESVGARMVAQGHAVHLGDEPLVAAPKPAPVVPEKTVVEPPKADAVRPPEAPQRQTQPLSRKPRPEGAREE